jgi:hypothetical protein
MQTSAKEHDARHEATSGAGFALPWANLKMPNVLASYRDELLELMDKHRSSAIEGLPADKLKAIIFNDKLNPRERCLSVRELVRLRAEDRLEVFEQIMCESTWHSQLRYDFTSQFIHDCPRSDLPSIKKILEKLEPNSPHLNLTNEIPSALTLTSLRTRNDPRSLIGDFFYQHESFQRIFPHFVSQKVISDRKIGRLAKQESARLSADGDDAELKEFLDNVHCAVELGIDRPLDYRPKTLGAVLQSRIFTPTDLSPICLCVMASRAADPASALTILRQQLDHFVDAGYQTPVYNIRDVNYIDAIREATINRGVQADVLLIAGHGTPSSVYLHKHIASTSERSEVYLTVQDQEQLNSLTPALAEGGRVIFYSCSVGGRAKWPVRGLNLVKLLRNIFPQAAQNGIVGAGVPHTHFEPEFNTEGLLSGVRYFKADREVTQYCA